MQDNNPNWARYLSIIGYAFLIVNIGTAVLSFLTIDKVKFGDPHYGPYSIFASKSMFIAYNIWLIIASAGTGITWYKQKRNLFYYFLLLLLILTFYPIFTHGK